MSPLSIQTRLAITMKFLAVIKKNFVMFVIARSLDAPISEIAALRELVEGRRKRPRDERKIRILPDVQDLAEFVVPLFINAIVARRIEPHLQERHKSFRNVVLQFAIRFKIDGE